MIEDEKDIVGIGELISDPDNARKHSKRNLSVIESSIREFGPARSIVIDKNGVVRAGNGTREAAKRAGVKNVRVVHATGNELVAVVRDDLSDVQAAAYALADNRASDLSEWDPGALQRAMDACTDEGVDLSKFGFDDLEIEEPTERDKDFYADSFVYDEDSEMSEPDEKERVFQDYAGSIYAFNEDAIFPSTNEWGIPELREDRLATIDDVPETIYTGEEITDFSRSLMIYGKHKVPDPCDGAIMAWYTDDAKFEAIWNDAINALQQLHKFKWRAICTPDFSMWRNLPLVFQLWNLYRSQWIARYWQEAGIKIIPSLKWCAEDTYKFIPTTAPKGCPLVSLQARTTRSRLGKEYFIKGLRECLKQLDPECIMVYGGLRHRSWIEPNLETKARIVWLSDWTTTIAERKKHGRK